MEVSAMIRPLTLSLSKGEPMVPFGELRVN
jgi:hypothetical protein